MANIQCARKTEAQFCCCKKVRQFTQSQKVPNCVLPQSVAVAVHNWSHPRRAKPSHSLDRLALRNALLSRSVENVSCSRASLIHLHSLITHSGASLSLLGFQSPHEPLPSLANYVLIIPSPPTSAESSGPAQLTSILLPRRRRPFRNHGDFSREFLQPCAS